MSKIIRAVVVLFGLVLLTSFVLGIADPTLGSSDVPSPTTGATLLRGWPVALYGLLLVCPRRLVPTRILVYSLLALRALGFIGLALGIFALLRDQGTSVEAIAILVLFPGLVTVGPAALAVWEAVAWRKLGSSSTTASAAAA